MTATKKDLDGLHALVARVLASELAKDRTDPETGETGDIPASLIAQAITFLKNNGIEAPDIPDGPVNSVVKALPFTDGDSVLN